MCMEAWNVCTWLEEAEEGIRNVDTACRGLRGHMCHHECLGLFRYGIWLQSVDALT